MKTLVYSQLRSLHWTKYVTVIDLTVAAKYSVIRICPPVATPTCSIAHLFPCYMLTDDRLAVDWSIVDCVSVIDGLIVVLEYSW
jgi:hypothetical protein